ncbi:hypothetical protein SRHO_G00134950 [Serrasalmus rhombeus]
MPLSTLQKAAASPSSCSSSSTGLVYQVSERPAEIRAAMGGCDGHTMSPQLASLTGPWHRPGTFSVLMCLCVWVGVASEKRPSTARLNW